MSGGDAIENSQKGEGQAAGKNLQKGGPSGKSPKKGSPLEAFELQVSPGQGGHGRIIEFEAMIGRNFPDMWPGNFSPEASLKNNVYLPGQRAAQTLEIGYGNGHFSPAIGDPAHFGKSQIRLGKMINRTLADDPRKNLVPERKAFRQTPDQHDLFTGADRPLLRPAEHDPRWLTTKENGPLLRQRNRIDSPSAPYI